MIDAELYSLQSGAASFVTPPFSLGDLRTFAIFVLFPGGGTLDGTLTIEASPDTTEANFVTVTGTTQAVVTSTQHTWSLVEQGYRYVRVRWVFNSGAGNMQILLQLKEFFVKGA